MRRAALLLLIALSLVAAGCSGKATESGPTTLELWARSDQASFAQGIIDAFNASHDDVKIDLTLIPSENFVQKLGVASAGGSGPDLASIDLVYVPFFAHSGVLADVTERADRLPYKDQLSRPHLQNSTYRERIYSLPFSGDASMLFYNADLFRRAGLDPDRPPRTWAQMYDAAKRIRALGKDYYGYSFSGACGGCNVFTFAPLIWASGGKLIEGTGGDEKPVVGDYPQVADALRFYNRLWDEGLVPPQTKSDAGALAQVPFRTGHIGMFATGSFNVGILDDDYPDLDYRVTPLPGRNGGSSSFTGGDNIAITASSEHPDEAWTFLRWATSAKVQDEHFGKAGVTPIRKDVAAGSYSRRSPVYAAFARALFSGQTIYSVQENALMNGNTSPWVTMISSGVFDGRVDEAVADAQQTMENILSRG